jgi:transketolase
MSMMFGPRRGVFINLSNEPAPPPSPDPVARLEALDQAYRSLCAILYNYVPGSGHPGGSISSGRFVQALLFGGMDYDLANPDAPDADLICYAAGHKALGLYALWALRHELARAGRKELVARERRHQFRLEDLLGFRRNPLQPTPLFSKLKSRALDGHPTPATPFVKLSTGASGVGIGASFGLALGALDVYRDDPPRVHVVEGEGGMTPGRVAEAFAAAGTMGLRNVVVHVDWNQASIDSNRVCREGGQPGDYVQWDPAEFAYLHDWNVIVVPDGRDFAQILAAQARARALDNGQPTAIVYRTVKGWRYGIEGRASHGAGHKLCANGFYDAVETLLDKRAHPLPRCCGDEKRCRGCDPAIIEECYWQALRTVRESLLADPATVSGLCDGLQAARDRLRARGRVVRTDAPRLERAYALRAKKTPPELVLAPGTSTTLRAALGDALNHLNKVSGGGFMVAAADLLGSTSVSNVGKGFPDGFWHARGNPGARVLSIGGICEDAMAALLSGLSTYGHHVGAGSSYAAFIAPLSHIAARLHAIGGQARRAVAPGEPYKPMIVVCAHAGLKTGEDGPTHADPQALQVFQDNFPRGTLLTLTPWEPAEIWPLLMTALQKRPAVIAPFVTRPNETVPDRKKLGLAPATDAVQGLYALRRADPKRKRDGTLVVQESGVAYAFVEEALPLLDRAGYNLNVFYVTSAELFDLLPARQQAVLFPEELAREAMGITGFTQATLDRWVTSTAGRAHSLHPFCKGHFLGSGAGAMVLQEAGLDGRSQARAIAKYIAARKRNVSTKS